MDISSSTAPRSDQQNYDDYIAGPRLVTVAEVKQGSAEQPVEVHLVEFPGRPYKPSKSMRRVLVAAWGAEASAYTGRKIRLYGDPEVTFGRDKVGGIKISALSHIDKPMSISLTVTRGKRAPFVVQPITPTELALTAINDATDTTKLDGIETYAHTLGIHADVTAAIEQKRAQLNG
jgi:hypothetical protein